MRRATRVVHEIIDKTNPDYADASESGEPGSPDSSGGGNPFARSKNCGYDNLHKGARGGIGNLEVSTQFLHPLFHSADSDPYAVWAKLHHLI